MPEVRVHHFLPALMGSLHQQRAEGELVLEQNDGTRRMYWVEGSLKYLRSDAVGEQFGSFLVRRGVLDMAALKELLADGDGARVGDRVVQWGLMSLRERDERLHELFGSLLLHAMEHPILKLTWIPGPLAENLAGDMLFQLDHRRVVWEIFQSAQVDQELVQMFLSEPNWRWEAVPNLLDALSDLPLTPTLAYALSLLGTEPLGCDTISSLTGLPQEKAARLVATLWALGGMNLVQGDLPLVEKAALEAPGPVAVPDIEIELEPELEQDIQLDLGVDDPISSEGFGSQEIDISQSVQGATPAPTLGSVLGMSSSGPHEDEEPPVGERARRLLIKAKSYMMQDRTSEAIRALEQAIKLDGDTPGAYETWMLLGRLRLSNPAWSTRAIEALQVASRLNPRAAEPWALMGELYHRKGFHANAQGCFRRALELDPSVAVPVGWSMVEETDQSQGGKDGQAGLMGRLKGMFGREKG
ncbi:tetratricopeptide repeat protein [Geothrix sp. PMB-07]|uniref:tetratricopeptide repeat protein n=1 Tax=Geothrix sp. PMB-07 TaxID=3068640 RepID=UPI0027421B9B|nr:tetratricopeptide repeat protein [Geothrix sp. PMB-07]WLT31785.1 tetratricopeptide repeat protein [Geothrix sp. PMB-07]